jgi:hypothetical protein
MKKLIYLLMIGLLTASCEKDDGLSPPQRNVISDEEKIPFEELLLLINIKTSDSTWLVVSSVDSVKIFINEHYWTKTNSQPIDTSKVAKTNIGNTSVASSKLNYLIIADQDIGEPDYNTAGEFAQYLNAAYELPPGEYACFIESLQVTLHDNTAHKYYPMQYSTFRIEQNLKSIFLGEIEIAIY